MAGKRTPTIKIFNCIFVKPSYKTITFKQPVAMASLQTKRPASGRKRQSLARCAQGRRLADDLDYAKRLKPVDNILNRQCGYNDDRDPRKDQRDLRVDIGFGKAGND